MRATEFKNRWKTDKRFRRSFCALLFAVGVAVTGVSLAYFTSDDSVTNRMESDYTYSLDIVLTEPKWDNTGEVEAAKSVPGMEIDKDPYVTNYMATDVYIRLKIEFVDGDGKTVSLPTNKTELVEINYDTTSCQINDGNKDLTYSRLLSTIYYYTLNSDGTAGTLTHLLTNNNDTLESGNPYFYYSDGYFYYLDYENTNNANKTNLKSLTYREKTAVPLFRTVKLPVTSTTTCLRTALRLK